MVAGGGGGENSCNISLNVHQELMSEYDSASEVDSGDESLEDA